MRRWLYYDVADPQVSTGLLVLRVVMGAAFVLHGWPKIQNPFGWMGPEGPPGVVQALPALAEFVGGIALIPGVLTRLAALGIACTMVGALGYHLSQGHPFVGTGGPSYELAAVYLAAAVLFLLAGPGRNSIDAGLFGPRGGLDPAPGSTPR